LYIIYATHPIAPEIGTTLGISTDTVTRDWQMAKLGLRRELKKDRPSDH
jgi:DNA-directed RNA polymerase specialized sigma24 family protein